MSILLVADIHANLPALEAVLQAAGSFDRVWCLGDVVGYGPHPNECLERLQGFQHLCVAGNHDWAALGKADLAVFNAVARRAALWTSDRLTPAGRSYLEERPLTLSDGEYTLTHGSPRDPIWEYLLSVSAARLNFDHFQTAHCFIGHSHVPLLFWQGHGSVEGRQLAEERLRLPDLGRVILNPGSVGQPRDGDWRASFALLDPETGQVEQRRVEYELERTQMDIRSAGLPEVLASRLSYGH